MVLDPEYPYIGVEVEVHTEREVVAEITNTLLRAFNHYLEQHEHVQFPEVFMALVNFHRVMLSFQADSMNLSPEQRESYFQTAIGALNRSMQGEIQRLTTAPTPRPTKPRRKRGDQL